MRQTNRQTDRPIDREKDRNMDIKVERQRCRATETHEMDKYVHESARLFDGSYPFLHRTCQSLVSGVVDVLVKSTLSNLSLRRKDATGE